MMKKDYTKQSKENLIKKIKQFRKHKRYNIVYENKMRRVVGQCKTELPVFQIIKDKKILAKIYFSTKHTIADITKDVLVSQLARNIKFSSVGYAGFSKKKFLREFLLYQIFDIDIDFKKKEKRNINQKEVKEIIDRTIRKCKGIIFSPITRIFVFPSYSSFTKNKMSGVSGYTPWQNTMLVFVDSTTKQWKKLLESTIAHEYLHTITRQYHKWETLLDSIIFEGLAENFVQDVLENKLSPWSRALDLRQSKKYLKKIKHKLESKDMDIYKSVFFKDKEYPLWTGYSIGYNIVKNFLNKQSVYSWEQIVKLKPKTILRNSGFI